MSKIKKLLSGNRRHPEIVTGNFSLHYEDVVKKNRYTIVALLAIGILGSALVVPIAVYRSVAETPDDQKATSQNTATATQDKPVSASLTLDSSTKTPVLGRGFDVTAAVYSSVDFKNVTAYLEFDPAQLSYVSVKINGKTPSQTGTLVSAGNGYVVIKRDPFDGLAGTREFAVVTFKSKKTGVTALISVNASQSRVNGSAPTSVNGTSITL